MQASWTLQLHWHSFRTRLAITVLATWSPVFPTSRVVPQRFLLFSTFQVNHFMCAVGIRQKAPTQAWNSSSKTLPPKPQPLRRKMLPQFRPSLPSKQRSNYALLHTDPLPSTIKYYRASNQMRPPIGPTSHKPTYHNTPRFITSAPFKTAKKHVYESNTNQMTPLEQACQLPHSKIMRPILDVHDKPFKLGFSQQPPRPQLPKPPLRSGQILVHQYE